MKKVTFFRCITISTLVLVFITACTSRIEQSHIEAITPPGQYASLIISPKYIATAAGILQDSSVLIKDGVITDVFPTAEVAQKASLNQAQVIAAPDDVLSPAFINTHDHISYNQKGPLPQLSCANKEKDPDVTYNQRNDWRKGCRNLTQLTALPDTAASVVAWNEIRQLISGTTVVVGNGGAPGFVRNLGDPQDKYDLREGLKSPPVWADTFPLGDTKNCQYQLPAGDGYPSHPSAEKIGSDIYIAHVAEGVDATARNEFTNISTAPTKPEDKQVNILGKNIGLVHMVAVLPSDVAKIKQSGTTIIWSPRSNMALYGNTPPIPLLSQQGINVALSTDWLYSGSANLLDELQVAQRLNADYFNHTLSNQTLWKMVTINPATLLDAPLGDIKPGLVADLVLFRVAPREKPLQKDIYGLMITSSLQDVDMVLRAGVPVYGDSELLAEVIKAQPGVWDTFTDATIAGKLTNKVINTVNQTSGRYPQAMHFADLEAVNKNNAGLIPDVDKEACPLPVRPLNKLANPAYEVPYPSLSPAEDKDQDGIKDSADNKKEIFNPVRPVDNGTQLNW